MLARKQLYSERTKSKSLPSLKGNSHAQLYDNRCNRLKKLDHRFSGIYYLFSTILKPILPYTYSVGKGNVDFSGTIRSIHKVYIPLTHTVVQYYEDIKHIIGINSYIFHTDVMTNVDVSIEQINTIERTSEIFYNVAVSQVHLPLSVSI